MSSAHDRESRARRGRRMRRTRITGGAPFQPSDLACVRAGMYWDPGVGSTNLGAANWNWAEGNAKTASDQQQPTTSKQPSLLSNNGSVQFNFDDEATDTRCITTGVVTAGWNGSTHLAMWLRWPGVGVANGMPNGTTTIFSHQTVAAGQRRLTLAHTGTDPEGYTLTLSQDGTATQQDKWDSTVDYPDPTSPNLWHWFEWIFTAGVGAELFVDFVQRAHLATAINLASINDTNDLIAVGSSTGAGVSQNVKQLGPLYYLPGPVSLGERRALAGVHAPITTTAAPWLIAA